MKRNTSLAILTLFLLVWGLMSCVSPATEIQIVLTESTTQEVEDEVLEPTSTLEPEVRFTIQAEEEFIRPITALYQAMYGDELPVFVAANGDILVKTEAKVDIDHPDVPSTFLPGVVLLPQNMTDDVMAFIEYAISLEGQKELINAGELPGEITLSDQGGKEVIISQPVERVISSYGPTTAIVYAVGGKDRLISASYLGAKDPIGFSVMAEMDTRFPDIMGDDKFSQSEFNIEEAASLDPDLILTSSRSTWLDIADELDVPIFLYEAETSDRLKDAVMLTGNLFGPQASATAQTWVSYFDSINMKIQEKTGDISSDDLPKVLFTGTSPLRVASGDMYQTELIEAAGGVSVSKELTGYWNDINLEQVVIWEPDIIIVPPYGGASVEAITESPEWQVLSAVQAGRVYQMPKLVVPWDTPAPDAVLGIVWLAQLLHPDLVDLDCSQEATYFYNTFYQYAIFDEITNEICAYD